MVLVRLYVLAEFGTIDLLYGSNMIVYALNMEVFPT
jgi:hypothetical protein